MNPHIEQLNNHLFGVRFSYVDAGWINEFITIDEKISGLHTVYTTDGKILLNKESLYYDEMKKIFKNKIMPLFLLK